MGHHPITHCSARRAVGCALLMTMMIAGPAACEAAETLEADVVPGEGYTLLSKIAPRHARDIEASNWSIGAETMGRDYTIYGNWRNYLGPLGAKKARIQSGWAKTEKEPGKYDWTWLDEIIPDMAAQGVEPWVCLCYGNPIYPGGGNTGLAGGLPSSPEALAAWDAYVAALVDRYKAHVDEWEVWNEPPTGRGPKGTMARYIDLVIRTAEIIRQRQPKATVMFAAGSAFSIPCVEKILTALRDQDRLSLVNAVMYHPYSINPDESYPKVEQLRDVVRSFSDAIAIRQGENGAPSVAFGFGALSQYDWTEQRQAKWATRRLLGDLGRGIPSSYFSICDMAYLVKSGTRKNADLRDAAADVELLVNTKGLLAVNDDKTVHHAKLAYAAVQHITALFDNTVTRISDFKATLEGGREDAQYTVFGYRSATGHPLVTLWRSSDPPGERPEGERLRVTMPEVKFDEPVWVDLVSGQVYASDRALWKQEGGNCVFDSLPVYDSVVVVADRAAIAERLIQGAGSSPRKPAVP